MHPAIIDIIRKQVRRELPDLTAKFAKPRCRTKLIPRAAVA